MTRLLKEGFPKMYTRGVAVSTLIPAEEWLYGYYAKFGYATVFHRAIRPWHPSVASQEVAGVEIIEKAGETVKREAYLYAAGHWQTQACYIVHTPEDYDAVIEELYMSGGKIALLRKGNAIAGMALALPEQDSVSVKEILYDSETIREKLLQGIARHWQTERVVYRTANPGGIPMRPYGMARIIHVEMLLQHLATEHPQLEKSFCVQDPILPENNGLYLLSHGECRKASCPATLPAMDIVGLSKALLEWDDAHPYMNQMLD